MSAAERSAARQEESKPLFDDMHAWLKRESATLSKSSEVIEPIDYMLKRWDGFARFLEDGRICLTNNAAERALRGIALGRRNWTFAGSQRGADRAAIMLSVITTCRLNDVGPKAWLAMCSPASPIFPSPACANYCRGNGRHRKGRLLRRPRKQLPEQRF